MDINWKQNTASKMWEPSRYPSDIVVEDYQLPAGIRSVWQNLNALIETKYSREHIKMCAFYNKLFPSLKSWDWSRSSHNSLPFSVQEQERTDTGTGITENFLKNAIDTVVARIANITFEAKLRADIPSIIYEICKEPVERYLKYVIRDNKLVRAVTEVFHDAAVLGFGHLFVDPWSGTIRKIGDWELGCYEAEFCEGDLKRALIRDFAFPITSLRPYLRGADKEQVKRILGSKPQVDLKLFIDVPRQEAYATVDSTTLPPIPYPFQRVLIQTFSWDIGVKRSMVTSLFDMLYPVQRTISKLNAKKTQLIEAYKGPVPVFNNDCDVIVKSMGNGAGEALFIAAGRNPAEVVTVINPTPLDPEMNAEKETLKGTLQELAGTQELNLDMENIRSAATVIALEQLHDQRFQSELSQIGVLVGDTLKDSLEFAASRPKEAIPIENVPWENVLELIRVCDIDVTTIHNNDPNNKPVEEPQDPAKVACDRAVFAVMHGDAVYEDYSQDYAIDPILFRQSLVAQTMRLRAVMDRDSESGEMDRLERAMLMAFIEDIKTGQVVL
jgi:hypothetical protein